MRLGHIDQMKAIAILFMVEVHTAAILPPEGITAGHHPAAFVAAAFGGMAAPLFVTVSGWGMHRGAKKRFANGLNSPAWIDWVLPRVVILTACQFLVNFLVAADRGGRFEWHTPGVLTLLAIAAIFAPFISRFTNQSLIPLFSVLALSPLFLGGINGSELSWFSRVDSVGSEEWLQRLLFNGTYPILPWLAFSTLGAIIAESEKDFETRKNIMGTGMIIFLISIGMSLYSEKPWALTEGEAVLTFFPTTTFFIFISAMFVLIAHELLLWNSKNKRIDLSVLESSGRLTLSIYVLHFAVLGVAAEYMMNKPLLGIGAAFTVTIAHTLIWIPLAKLHQRYCPKMSIEELLRRVSN
tara:strand:+ start:11195 stop:12253 length:1059 start_codon:yes stop_codon:yes gene_type:complete